MKFEFLKVPKWYFLEIIWSAYIFASVATYNSGFLKKFVRLKAQGLTGQILLRPLQLSLFACWYRPEDNVHRGNQVNEKETKKWLSATSPDSLPGRTSLLQSCWYNSASSWSFRGCNVVFPDRTSLQWQFGQSHPDGLNF